MATQVVAKKKASVGLDDTSVLLETNSSHLRRSQVTCLESDMATVLLHVKDSVLADIFKSMPHDAEFNDFLSEVIISGMKNLALPAGGLSSSVGNLSRVLRASVEQARHLATGKEFHLDEVCPVGDWKTLSPGERKSLGKLFRKALVDEAIASFAGRTSTNKAIYIRK